MQGKNYFKIATTVAAATLTGLTLLLNQPSNSSASLHFDSQSNQSLKPLTLFSSPCFEDLVKESHAYESERQEMKRTILFTYEEWKDFNRYQESSESSTKRRRIDGPHALEIKAVLMTQNPDLAFSLLTPKEVQDYKTELTLFDEYDIFKINQKYSLNLSPEQFIKNKGAMALWSLNRQYSYRNSEEKSKISNTSR